MTGVRSLGEVRKRAGLLRRGIRSTALILPLSLGVATSEAAAQVTTGTAFVDATVITMSTAGVLENHTVLVRGDTIVAVGPSSSLNIPAEYRQIDARGRFLMPGLADMHVHLSGSMDLAANLRWGVTSVLQMGGQRGAISDFISLRDEIELGVTPGPRLFLAGPMFVGNDVGILPDVLRDHVAAGYDFAKVHNFTSAGVYRYLVESGEIPVIGHIPMGMSADETLASGQILMSHSFV